MRSRHVHFLVLVVILASTFILVPPVFAPYRDYQYLMADFMALADSFPTLVTYETIGKTILNKDIIMFKIGNPNGGKVLFDGAMHGIENLGSELLLFYSNWLLTSNDPLAQRMLSGTCTMIIPALNVDRYNRGRTNAHGVDLNRNFATNWEFGGSTNPDSDTYRGPAPLSEPESQTLIRIFQTYKPHFYVNLHMWADPYYAGSSYGNRTYYSDLKNKIDSLSYERGVTPLRGSGQLSGAGFAISDAALAGVTSFLIELAETAVPYTNIRTVLLPRFIPVAAVLSQESESQSSASAFPPWDVNQDGRVDTIDVAIACKAYGSTWGSPYWSPRADVDSNRVVDIADVSLISGHFGETYAHTRIGVSYTSNDQHYSDTTGAVLDQDFRFFRDNNIRLISINVIWAAVEPEIRGMYDSSVISNLKRVLAKAEEYGIKVLFSFHTHFQQQENPYQTPWHLPLYVADPYTGKKITLAIVRSEEMRDAFLDYVQYVVSQVKSSSAIEVWSLLNEPMYWADSGLPSGFSHKQSFQQLMDRGNKLIRSLDSRPVTVKFALPDSPWSNDFDLGTIMQIFDKIIALNVYIDPVTGRDSWGMTLADLNRAISDCVAYSGELWIAEFGKTTLNDESQRIFFRDSALLFQNAGIKTLLAWTWIHVQTGMPDDDRGWSICYDGGEPRPAFLEFKSARLE